MVLKERKRKCKYSNKNYTLFVFILSYLNKKEITIFFIYYVWYLLFLNFILICGILISTLKSEKSEVSKIAKSVA